MIGRMLTLSRSLPSFSFSLACVSLPMPTFPFFLFCFPLLTLPNPTPHSTGVRPKLPWACAAFPPTRDEKSGAPLLPCCTSATCPSCRPPKGPVAVVLLRAGVAGLSTAETATRSIIPTANKRTAKMTRWFWWPNCCNSRGRLACGSS